MRSAYGRPRGGEDADGGAIGKLTAAVASGLAAREELFLQTKFTFRLGEASIAVQVEQSFAKDRIEE